MESSGYGSLHLSCCSEVLIKSVLPSDVLNLLERDTVGKFEFLERFKYLRLLYGIRVALEVRQVLSDLAFFFEIVNLVATLVLFLLLPEPLLIDRFWFNFESDDVEGALFVRDWGHFHLHVQMVVNVDVSVFFVA